MNEEMRKLDALVAERVMEWKRHDWRFDPCLTPSAGGILICRNCNHEICSPPWTVKRANGFCGHGIEEHDSGIQSYSTDISAAWEVVERMHQLKFHGAMTIGKFGHSCTFTNFQDQEGSQQAKIAPLAICLAALRAVGVTEEEIKEVTK